MMRSEPTRRSNEKCNPAVDRTPRRIATNATAWNIPFPGLLRFETGTRSRLSRPKHVSDPRNRAAHPLVPDSQEATPIVLAASSDVRLACVRDAGPLAPATVAIIASAALDTSDDDAFAGGDMSFRFIDRARRDRVSHARVQVGRSMVSVVPP